MATIEVGDRRAAQTCQDWRNGQLDGHRARVALLLLALTPALVAPAAAAQAPDDSAAATATMHRLMVELLQGKVLDESPNAPLCLDAIADGRIVLSRWVHDLLTSAGPFLRRRMESLAAPHSLGGQVTSLY